MSKSSKKTVVIGASTKPQRYSHLAVKKLVSHDIEVVAIGYRPGEIDKTPIQTGTPNIEDVHTITLYLGQDKQIAIEDYILSLDPKRIIFNPGAENTNLFNRARENGIEVLNACTLVMLNTKQY